jgi:hypothetical protein
MKKAVLWVVTMCDSLRNRRFARTFSLHHQDAKICEIGKILSITSNWNPLRRNINCIWLFLRSALRLVVLLTVCLASWFFPLWWWNQYAPPKRRLGQEPYGITSQNTACVWLYLNVFNALKPILRAFFTLGMEKCNTNLGSLWRVWMKT